MEQIEKGKLFIGCLNCSSANYTAPMDMLVCVGFGDAYVTKDGQTVYDGEADENRGEQQTGVLTQAENDQEGNDDQRFAELQAIDEPRQEEQVG